MLYLLYNTGDIMFELAIGMVVGSFISIISIYLTLNHKIKNENSIEQALEKATDGDYKIEIKNGLNYASADLKLFKKRLKPNGTK